MPALYCCRYMSALYWSLTSLMKTPSVAPDTEYEKWFTAFLVVAGSLFFAMMLAQVDARDLRRYIRAPPTPTPTLTSTVTLTVTPAVAPADPGERDDPDIREGSQPAAQQDGRHPPLQCVLPHPRRTAGKLRSVLSCPPSQPATVPSAESRRKAPSRALTQT